MVYTYGSRGAEVAKFQKMLSTLGYSCLSELRSMTIGNITVEAIKRFQSNAGISITGCLDELTSGLISNLYYKRNSIVGLDARTTTSSLTKSLSKTANDSPRSGKLITSMSKEVFNTKISHEKDMNWVNGAPENFILINNLTYDPPRHIRLYGTSPDEFSESHSTSYETVTIKSRSNQLMSYGGSESRTLEVSFDIHEDYLKMYIGQQVEIHHYVAQLKALTYPRYDNGVVIPPRLYIRIGEFIKMRAICNNCQVTWRKPIRNGKYISATVTMSLTEILSISFNADEIISGGDLGRYDKWEES